MSLYPLNAHLSTLRPLTLWCLDTFGEDAPMLVGVKLGPKTVHFHPVQLSKADPIGDLTGLAAPPDWDAVVVVAPTETINTIQTSGTVAHAVDRHGSSATELDDLPSGRQRSLQTLRGGLHSTCLALFTNELKSVVYP